MRGPYERATWLYHKEFDHSLYGPIHRQRVLKAFILGITSGVWGRLLGITIRVWGRYLVFFGLCFG